MARKDAQPGKRAAAAERRVKALELRKSGTSYRAIGAQLNISEKTAHQDVQQSLAHLASLELDSADELRTMDLSRLDFLVMNATRVLLSAGDGLKLQAIDRLLRISESRRRLLGLDAQPDALILGDVEITIRWPNDRTTIDVTPTVDRDSAAALPAPTGDREEPGTLSDRVGWAPLWEE